MLSSEDLARRATFIGASEIAAVCGMDPRQSPFDVWARKITPSRGPIVAYNKPSTVEQIAGHLFEPAILELYGYVTGGNVKRNEQSLVHKEKPYLGATPDGFVVEEVLGVPTRPRLVQIKARGWQSEERREFKEGLVPDVVRLQVLQEIHVARSHFPELVDGDVAAQLELTSAPAIFRVQYDSELAGEMLDLAARFWTDYVLGDKPPPQGAMEGANEYLRKRFPVDDGSAAVLDEATQSSAEELAVSWVNLSRHRTLLTRDQEAIEAQLKEIMGEAKTLVTARGRFSWAARNGQVSHKSLAEELAGGAIPEEIATRHRGAPSRVFRFDPAKGEE